MKNVLSLLACLLLIALSSSCALALGQRRASCEPPVLPIRPPVTLCIANPDGTGECSGPTGVSSTKPIVNYVCTSVSDYTREEEWIESVLKAANP